MMFSKKLQVFVLIFGIILLPAIVSAQESHSRDLNLLKDEIEDKKVEIDRLNKQKATYEEQIKLRRTQQLTLDNQLNLLEDRISKAEIEIQSLGLQTDQVNLEIRSTEYELTKTSKEISLRKQEIKGSLQQLNQLDRQSPVQVMLVNNSLSDFIAQVNQLEALQGGLQASLEKLDNLKTDLLAKRKYLNDKNDLIGTLRDDIDAAKGRLDGERIYKNQLFTEARNDESKFKKLLSSLRETMEEIDSEIQSLERKVRERLKGRTKLLDSDSVLDWPVPGRIITSYFHDPEYPYRNVFEHPAIDIRARQSTPIRAAAGGYVAKARKCTSSRCYSYVLLIHDKGLSTVYGHLSKIYVKQDAYVTRGQTIALSGGLPGTVGAGRMTTGPHQHFEVRKNGLPVNPLNYLRRDWE